MAGETVITIIGNLTADPELRYSGSGSPVANFTVASTPRTFDRNSGQWRDGETLFMRCSVWREVAENVAESLTKGTRVIVQGRLTQRSYQTRDGQQRTTVELQVDEIGASLRYASVQVSKNPSRFNNNGGGDQYGGGSGGGYSQSYGGGQGYGQGSYGQGGSGVSYNAAPGGSDADPWATSGPGQEPTNYDSDAPF